MPCLDLPVNIDTRIKFRHLVCFLEVARQGTLARAADKLAVSQPAISKTLRELEDLLGASLFVRGHGGVTLSEAGWLSCVMPGPACRPCGTG